MQKLVVIRHAESRFAGQLHHLGKVLIKRFSGLSVTLLSSSSTKAAKSAELIADMFSIPFAKHQSLRADRHQIADNGELLELVDSIPETDVLILITHPEYVEQFPGYFTAHRLRGRNRYISDTVDGAAYVLDCSSHNVERIGPFA